SSRARAASRGHVGRCANVYWQRKHRDRAVPCEARGKTDIVESPRTSNATPGLSRKPGKFSRRTARTRKARNQIRISRPRNLALYLFPRSRRAPTRDYDLRIAQAVLTCHVERSRDISRHF